MIERPRVVGALLLALCACKASPSTPTVTATPTVTTTPTAATTPTPRTVETVAASQGPARSADGRAFAVEVRYQGECAPAGSRGGCYVYTFAPDGTGSHILLDARLSGRYRLDGDTVLFTSTAPDAAEERLPLTEGGRVLAGTYRLQP